MAPSPARSATARSSSSTSNRSSGSAPRRSTPMRSDRLRKVSTLPALAALLLPAAAFAQGASPVALDSGDTAWMLTATMLVLLMTIPGLALFYGGMVRAKNLLSVLMQCFAITAVVTILWVVYGYSLAFDTTGMQAGVTNIHSFIGGVGPPGVFWGKPTTPSPNGPE